jgi:hypothetical protein
MKVRDIFNLDPSLSIDVTFEVKVPAFPAMSSIECGEDLGGRPDRDQHIMLLLSYRVQQRKRRKINL